MKIALVLVLVAAPSLAQAQELEYPPARPAGPKPIVSPVRADTTNVSPDALPDRLVDLRALTRPLGSPVFAPAAATAGPNGTIDLPPIESGIGPVESPLVTVDTSVAGGVAKATAPVPDSRILDQLVPQSRLNAPANPQLTAAANAQPTAAAPAGVIAPAMLVPQSLSAAEAASPSSNGFRQPLGFGLDGHLRPTR